MGDCTVRFQDINTFDGAAFMAFAKGQTEKYNILITGIATLRTCTVEEVDRQIMAHLNALRGIVEPIRAQHETVAILLGDKEMSEEQEAALDRLLSPHKDRFYTYCANALAFSVRDSNVVLDAILKLKSR
jgi:hypothetical protein